MGINEISKQIKNRIKFLKQNDKSKMNNLKYNILLNIFFKNLKQNTETKILNTLKRIENLSKNYNQKKKWN